MKNGYYYDAGQQDTKLVITKVPGGVRYADAHTDVIRSKPDSCRKKPARNGSVVVCKVPKTVNARHPMTLKIFTRLGNDYIDSTALPRHSSCTCWPTQATTLSRRGPATTSSMVPTA